MLCSLVGLSSVWLLRKRKERRKVEGGLGFLFSGVSCSEVYLFSGFNEEICALLLTPEGV